jgi:hypothetical protein
LVVVVMVVILMTAAAAVVTVVQVSCTDVTSDRTANQMQ